MKDAEDRVRFLRAISENGEWLDRLNDNVLPSLLRMGDDKVIESVITYLWIIIQHRPEAVVARLEPYLGKSEPWDDRIAFCLTRLNDWKIEKALVDQQRSNDG